MVQLSAFADADSVIFMNAAPPPVITSWAYSQPSKKIITAATLFVLFSAITWFRFHAWEPKLFYGDDLFNYLLYHGDRFNSHWANLFFADSGQKFRFVFSSAMRVEISAFHKSIAGYLAVNLVTHATSAVLFCFIASRLCRSWPVSILLGIVAATSRLSLYEVTQVTGQVEGIALVFCLLTILCIISSIDDSNASGNTSNILKWVALLFAFLAFNTHERYIVLLPWLAIFFVLPAYGGTVRQGVTFCLISIAMVAINAAIKALVYHSNFFEGTGGVPLAVNLQSMLSLLSQAVFSIIGINHGPQYLVGAEWSDFSIPIKIISVALAIATVSFAVAALTLKNAAPTDRANNWSVPLLFLAGLLIAPSTLTIRMEQRWELASYFLALFLVADGATRLIRAKKVGRGPVIAGLVYLAISTAAINARVAESYPTLLASQTFAENVKRSVVDSKSTVPGTPVIFVSDVSNCVGTLIDGGFFIPLEGRYRPVYCVKSVDDTSPSGFPPSTHIYETNSLGKMIDFTTAWRSSSKRS